MLTGCHDNRKQRGAKSEEWVRTQVRCLTFMWHFTEMADVIKTTRFFFFAVRLGSLTHPPDKCRGVSSESHTKLKLSLFLRHVLLFLQETVQRTLDEQHWQMLAPCKSTAEWTWPNLRKYHRRKTRVRLNVFLITVLFLWPTGTASCGSTASLPCSTSSSRCCVWLTTPSSWSTEKMRRSGQPSKPPYICYFSENKHRC